MYICALRIFLKFYHFFICIVFISYPSTVFNKLAKYFSVSCNKQPIKIKGVSWHQGLFILIIYSYFDLSNTQQCKCWSNSQAPLYFLRISTCIARADYQNKITINCSQLSLTSNYNIQQVFEISIIYFAKQPVR